ncbi:MAG: RNA chaperone Hfq [Eubacteriales bacterium]|nr:RNA chaperone Hfq [Eubacteriales bacterium]
MTEQEGFYFKDQAGCMRSLDWQPDFDWSWEEDYKHRSRNSYGQKDSKKRSHKRSWEGRPYLELGEDRGGHSRNSSLANSSKIQELFLNYCRKNLVRVALTLASDQKVEGYILGFDQEIIVIEVEHRQVLMYKSAIRSIQPLTEEHCRILSDDPLVMARASQRPN